MTSDIKELATMMGSQFADAVKLAEKAEADEIDSIIKSMNQSYEIYVTQLAKIHENEQAVETAYQDELLSLSQRLEIFKQAKLGNKVSDEAVARRANGLGVRP